METNPLVWAARFALVWVLIWVLVGCQSQPIIEGDTYTDLLVSVKWSDTPVPRDPDIAGYYYRTGSICHIASSKPKFMDSWKERMCLGHELLHCIYGNWHGDEPHGC